MRDGVDDEVMLKSSWSTNTTSLDAPGNVDVMWLKAPAVLVLDVPRIDGVDGPGSYFFDCTSRWRLQLVYMPRWDLLIRIPTLVPLWNDF